MLRLKFLRIERGLRQQQIADLLGVPRPHLPDLERGVRNPSPKQREAVERLFDCPADRLFTHVSADSLEPGAEARDAHEERQS